MSSNGKPKNAAALPASSRNGKLGSLLALLRVRPGPEKVASRERVRATPPTPEPRTPFEHFSWAVEDIQAVLDNDPAARHAAEVILTYPGLHAVWLHRIAHAMWTGGLITLPRLLAHMNRMTTGIEIHPGAKLGRGVFIDHGMGIVIGETATVGDHCLLYTGVVLGGTSLERKERHPTLGHRVVIGSNACVLGPVQVGDGAKVGSNSVVIRDVPAEATVVGVPGRIGSGGPRKTLDHANLPDPVVDVVESLINEIERLRTRVDQLEQGGASLAGRSTEHDEFEDA